MFTKVGPVPPTTSDAGAHLAKAAGWRGASQALTRLDLACLLGLVALWAAMLLVRYDAFPLQIWDEARNAVDAHGVATTGRWLSPPFGNAPDHYHTKPPLLIWTMSLFMRMHLPLLLAVRLPSFLAALACAVLAWAVCRFKLNDPLTAVISALLLLTSSFFMGFHVARTGDYDMMLTFFLFCYVLAFWAATVRPGPVRLSYFAVFAAALFLAVMTKGVAGTFALPGLALYALLTGRVGKLITNPRAWLLLLLAIGLCLTYYMAREMDDPGYLQLVWLNELGGRYFETNENHQEGFDFYPRVFLEGFKLGIVLLPLALLPLFRTNPWRRSFSVACLLTAGVIGAVLSTAKTKLAWYPAPMLPLLAIAIGIGGSDFCSWLTMRAKALHPRARFVFPAALAGMFLWAGLVTFRDNQFWVTNSARAVHNGQFWYGSLFNELLAGKQGEPVLVVDGGLKNDSGMEHYNPMLMLYADLAAGRGLEVRILTPENAVPNDALVATCDPDLVPALRARPGFRIEDENRWCVGGRSVSLR